MCLFVMWLTKMSTAIGLLLAAALFSMVGTFIPQYLTRLDYIGRYGEWVADTILLLGLDHVYRSWWFLALMAVVLGSVTLCLWRNGQCIVKHMFVPSHEPHKGWFAHAQQISSKEINTLKHWHTVGEARVAVSGRLNRLGYFLLHIGVVGVAVGGLVTGFVGFRATLNIREGETDNAARIFRAETMRIYDLPFTVTNTQFSIDAYASGQPRQYTTQLRFENQNKNISLIKTVSVNTPVTVGNYTFYQSTFGDGGSAVEFEFFPLHTASALQLKRTTIEVYNSIVSDGKNTGGVGEEWGQNTYTLLDRVPQVIWQGQSFGPGVTLKLERPTMAPVQFQMYEQYPQLIGVPFQKGRGADSAQVDFIPLPAAFAVKEYNLNEIPRVLRTDPVLYSGLQVVYDPGKYIFWPSCLMLLVGIYSMLTRRYSVVWEKDGVYYKSCSPIKK